MAKPKLLLLNPPSRRAIIRDCYCSQESKASYLWAPMDLLAQSGILRRDFVLRFVDAVACRMTPEAVLALIAREKFAGILMLVGWVSFAEDMKFIAEIRRRFPGTKLLCGGDIMHYYAGQFIEAHPEMGAALADWASPDTPAYFAGGSGLLRGIRRPGETEDRAWEDTVRFGLPDYSLPDLSLYRLPIPGFRNAVTTIASDGCPGKCDYCVVERSAYRPRDLAEVEAELADLDRRGVRNIFFHDATFNAREEHFRALLGMLAKRNGRLRFVAFFRGDTLAEADVEALKRAGCAAMLLGIESYDPWLLQKHSRSFELERVKAVARKARASGILTVGHFITRLSRDDEMTVADEAAFIKSCGTDFVSVAELMLRPGSTLFNNWLSETGGDVVAVCREAAGRLPARNGAFTHAAPTPRAMALMRRHYLSPATLFRLRGLLLDPRNWRDVATDAVSVLKR